MTSSNDFKNSMVILDIANKKKEKSCKNTSGYLFSLEWDRVLVQSFGLVRPKTINWFYDFSTKHAA